MEVFLKIIIIFFPNNLELLIITLINIKNRNKYQHNLILYYWLHR